MPSRRPVLHAADADRLVADHGFVPRPVSDERLVGLEVEWLTVRLDRPTDPADLDAVRAAADAAGPLPHASRVSFEPGGQIELSTRPHPRLDAITALAEDAARLGEALARAGVGIVGIGLEPGARRDRVTRSPRYDAMEAYFDVGGPAGRTMMRSTAAIQLNLDLGVDLGVEVERRWAAAHALGPVLAASFAHSPFFDGRPSGWRSTRLAVWNAIDPTRTMPVGNGVACRQAWARYALEADVMLVRRSDTEHVALRPGLSFGAWIEQGHELGWPTADDLEYHLTTLFPPVRPRGWLELRMVDALPDPWWRVAGAVTAALLNDPDAAARAARATVPTSGLWLAAARESLEHPALAAAAIECFDAARAALPGLGADPTTLDATDRFVERFVARGRCPADDLLDGWARDGTLLPTPDNA